MKLRQIYHWHLFIQWLATKDLLDEYLDQVLIVAGGHYMHHAVPRLMNRPSNFETRNLFSNMTMDEKLMLNVRAVVEDNQNRLNYSERFSFRSMYRNLNKEGNQYHGLHWYRICDKFAEDVLNHRTTARRKGISTIRRAWTNTGATLPEE